MTKEELRILFMGTPDISRRCLEQLISDGYNIVGAFTRRDKPVGRKQIMTAPPVKEVALRHGIPVYQPKTLKGKYSRVIEEIAPDMIVVVAYGRILPKAVIDVPKFGCLNLHVSLLPKYRGAAPIQWAVINGEEKTGVTVMMIDEGLDTGDIIDVLPIDIGEDETSEDVFEKVTELGKTFLSKVIMDVARGNFTRTAQDHSKATLAPPLEKEMGLFDFTEDARTIHNRIRGMYSWPCAYFMYEGKKVKVLSSRKRGECVEAPGTIISTKPLTVATGNGAIRLMTMSPEGGKTMDGTSWANGRRLKKGSVIVTG